MKIAFMCASFVEGRDGVGDYVGRIAETLAARGHRCQVIAAADRYLPSGTVRMPPTTERPFEVVRVAQSDWEAGRLGAAESAARDFAPEWTSLQMVCYGFARRGLLAGMTSRFERLAAADRRHLMWHELWIGTSAGATIKDRVVGRAQRHYLIEFARRWGASVAHTSNPSYQELLRRVGLSADVLPLPGGIAIARMPPGEARVSLMRRLAIEPRAPNEALIAGVFGAIHPEWLDADPIQRLGSAARAVGKRLVLIQLGRAGLRGLSIWRELERRVAGAAQFAQLGEQPANEMSASLQGLDVGLATSPWALIGKSSAVSTMVEHGVPVLVTRDDWRLRVGPTPDPVRNALVERLCDDSLRRLRDGTFLRQPPSADGTVYDRLEKALTGA